MNSRFYIWALILVVSLVTTGLAIRILALKGIPLAESLVVRGTSCLFFVLVLAYKDGLSLWPRSLKTQFFRALLAGLALMLFSMSYNWLTASTVSVLSNIDVPLLVILGPLVGVKTSWRAKVLSLISILFLVCYVSGLEAQTDLSYGLASLMTACFLLCWGYFFIKKSMKEENQAITILIPALAIIVYGLMGHIGTIKLASLWNPHLFFIDILSGAGMFGAYVATMRLYAVTDLASAEFPTLISSLVIQPFEAIFLDVPLQTIYLMSSLGFVVIIYFILNWQKPCTQSYPIP